MEVLLQISCDKLPTLLILVLSQLRNGRPGWRADDVRCEAMCEICLSLGLCVHVRSIYTLRRANPATVEETMPLRYKSRIITKVFVCLLFVLSCEPELDAGVGL